MANKKYYDDDLSPEEKYYYLLLYAPGSTGAHNEPVRGNTWLQKEMFLLAKNVKNLHPQFDEHYFGAFSPVLDILTAQNSKSEFVHQPYERGSLYLTDKGVKIASKLWNSASDYEREIIIEVKSFLNDLNIWELIAFSYSTFPETTERSDIIEKFHQTRLESAISLFMKKKVSLEKAASIAGKSIQDFMLLLKQRNIPLFETNEQEFKSGLKHLEGYT